MAKNPLVLLTLIFGVMKPTIRFYNEDIRFVLPQKANYRSWIATVAQQFGKKVGELTFIFCSDDYLLSINKQFLAHDYFTDIITFDYGTEDTIAGDIYISIDRVQDNASKFLVDKNLELQRVVIHGVLHLCGLKDKSENDQKNMRKAEEDALLLFDKK